MDNEKFFQVFGEIDDKFIRQVNEDVDRWQEAREGVSVRAGSSRRSPVRIALASVACAAVAFGAFFLLRNVGKNGIMYEPSSSQNNAVQSDDNVPGTVSTAMPDDNESTRFEAIDPVEDRITYVWKVEPDRISYNLVVEPDLISYDPIYEDKYEDKDTSMQYLREFFGNENNFVYAELVDAVYPSSWSRSMFDGHFVCDVAVGSVGAGVFAPAGGKVITVDERGDVYGNAVAVEMPEGKIFVIMFLDEVYVKVGDVVTEGQQLGVYGKNRAGEVGYPKLRLVIMKKEAIYERPYTYTAKFDGLILTATNNKTIYDIGEPINVTISLENDSGRDVYLYYGWSEQGKHVDLAPYDGQNLIDIPVKGDQRIPDVPRNGVVLSDDSLTLIPLKQGETYVQNFTFQTHTDYNEYVEEIEDLMVMYPDTFISYNIGIHFGYFTVIACTSAEYPYCEVSEYNLIWGTGANLPRSVIESVTSEVSTTEMQYTDEMLEDYFIYNGVLYTNCYTYPIDWVIAKFEELDPEKVDELVTAIKGRADLQKFEDNTANVLPDSTEIFAFPDKPNILLARSGDEYIPYMAMVEG